MTVGLGFSQVVRDELIVCHGKHHVAVHVSLGGLVQLAPIARHCFL